MEFEATGELTADDVVSLLSLFVGSDSDVKLADWWNIVAMATAPPLTTVMESRITRLMAGEITVGSFLNEVVGALGEKSSDIAKRSYVARKDLEDATLPYADIAASAAIIFLKKAQEFEEMFDAVDSSETDWEEYADTDPFGITSGVTATGRSWMSGRYIDGSAGKWKKWTNSNKPKIGDRWSPDGKEYRMIQTEQERSLAWEWMLEAVPEGAPDDEPQQETGAPGDGGKEGAAADFHPAAPVFHQGWGMWTKEIARGKWVFATREPLDPETTWLTQDEALVHLFPDEFSGVGQDSPAGAAATEAISKKSPPSKVSEELNGEGRPKAKTKKSRPGRPIQAEAPEARKLSDEFDDAKGEFYLMMRDGPELLLDYGRAMDALKIDREQAARMARTDDGGHLTILGKDDCPTKVTEIGRGLKVEVFVDTKSFDSNRDEFVDEYKKATKAFRFWCDHRGRLCTCEPKEDFNYIINVLFGLAVAEKGRKKLTKTLAVSIVERGLFGSYGKDELDVSLARLLRAAGSSRKIVGVSIPKGPDRNTAPPDLPGDQLEMELDRHLDSLLSMDDRSNAQGAPSARKSVLTPRFTVNFKLAILGELNTKWPMEACDNLEALNELLPAGIRPLSENDLAGVIEAGTDSQGKAKDSFPGERLADSPGPPPWEARLGISAIERDSEKRPTVYRFAISIEINHAYVESDLRSRLANSLQTGRQHDFITIGQSWPVFYDSENDEVVKLLEGIAEKSGRPSRRGKIRWESGKKGKLVIENGTDAAMKVLNSEAEIARQSLKLGTSAVAPRRIAKSLGIRNKKKK